MERPNAHTRFAYEVVQRECDRIGVPLPTDHEHAFNEDVLRIEEQEYEEAFRLLCPSAFTAQTFLDRRFRADQLSRHFYGVDLDTYHSRDRRTNASGPFTALFVGVCAVRKGLHFALDAWLQSPASQSGRFLIAGEFIPAYQEALAPMLAHPSVTVLGHRNDIPDLMRASDVLLLPTIEEGFGLVCTEAMASGCVPLVSEACTDLCRHGDNALVHRVGDVAALTEHITMVHSERRELTRLRENGLATAPSITWAAAGRHLVSLYRTAMKEYAEARRGSSELNQNRSNGVAV
jgi:glycosyltransferase involved in cell wall biosynthesis